MLRKENEKRLKRNQRSPIVTLTTIQPKHQSPRIKPRLWSTAAQVRAGTKPPDQSLDSTPPPMAFTLSIVCKSCNQPEIVVVQPLIWLDLSTFLAAYNLPSDLWTLVIFFYELNYLYILLNMYKLTKMLCDMFHILCICKDC